MILMNMGKKILRNIKVIWICNGKKTDWKEMSAFFGLNYLFGLISRN